MMSTRITSKVLVVKRPKPSVFVRKKPIKDPAPSTKIASINQFGCSILLPRYLLLGVHRGYLGGVVFRADRRAFDRFGLCRLADRLRCRALLRIGPRLAGPTRPMRAIGSPCADSETWQRSQYQWLGVPGEKLQRDKKLLVVGMVADKEPQGEVGAEDTDGAIVLGDASWVDRLGRVDLLEPEARVARVSLEKEECRSGSATDIWRQAAKLGSKCRSDLRLQRRSGWRSVVVPSECSRSASWARRESLSGDREKASAHVRSDRSSARSHSAKESCSSSGSCDASSRACYRSFVTLPPPATTLAWPNTEDAGTLAN